MLDKLKNLFIVEDESAKTKSKQSSNNTPATKANNSKAPSPKSKVDAAPLDKSVPARGKGQPEEKFVHRLLEALEENNLEGFDYLEYKQTVQSLGADMDEATKYKSSLAMAKTMGATPQNLVSSAEHYLKILKTEETKFQQALEGQHQKVVTGTEQLLTQLEQSIKQKEAQIEQLTKEIEQAKAQLKEKKSGVNNNLAKINLTKEGFYAAYHIVVDQIADDVEKMKKYLG